MSRGRRSDALRDFKRWTGQLGIDRRLGKACIDCVYLATRADGKKHCTHKSAHGFAYHDYIIEFPERKGSACAFWDDGS